MRLRSLDGLRAVCVLGVLYAHSWAAYDFPRLELASVNLTQLLSVGGNGVDFFFVISGFCMYYFYSDKGSVTLKSFLKFIFKRWRRISPAYYVACTFYIISSENLLDLSVKKLLFVNTLYLQTIFPEYQIEGHFWSLCTEFEFYLLLPLLLFLIKNYGFWFSLLTSCIACVLIAIIIDGQSNSLSMEGYWSNHIFIRFPEFCIGIIVAKVLGSDYSFKNFLPRYNTTLICFGIILILLGRFMITDLILNYYENLRIVTKILGLSIMAGGFGCILLLTLLNPNSILSKLLDSTPLNIIGRYSYSFYLLHVLALIITTPIIVKCLGNTSIGLISGFICSLIVTLPLAAISFFFLEKPFLKKINNK